MTYIFEFEHQTIWSPANRVAALYLDMLEATADMLKKPTGLTESMGSGDSYAIDPVAFPEFVAAMLRYFVDHRHPQMRLLLGSVPAVSIGVLDRAEIVIEPRDEGEREALDELRAFMRG
ncbi:DUF6086 family protein [Actinoplanes sp. NPDC048796]|uniref:DUF6086 family protein n=1 Tax=Actinoplanes sp. NPDC048796 TaxID=3155640 RepID=UPI0033F67D47